MPAPGAPRGKAAPPGFHTAVFPPSTDSLVELLEPYLREGLERGAASCVTLGGPRLAAVREALGPDGGDIGWFDTAAGPDSPGRRLRALHEFVERARHARGVPHCLVGEMRFASGSGDALTAEWLRVDAIADDLVGDTPVELVCVYDGSTLSPAIVAHAERLHRRLGLSPPTSSMAFVPPAAFMAELSPASLPLPGGVDCLVGTPLTPPAARRFLRDLFGRRSLDARRVDELVLVATELVTNANKAGATWVALSCWATPRGLVLQVDDDGCGMSTPHAGFLPPPPDAIGGRGLWIARQLADVVEIAPRPRGTSVRVHAGREPAGA